MGKMKLEPQQSNTTINHFSHPQHPLELITHQNFASSQLCSGCKVQANTGSVYTCKSCNFFLHIECSQMPKQITHPFDKQHTFTLFPKPIYPEGNFRCDACGETGDGFCYHCKSCGTDLHILCAVLPQRVTHWSHNHQLELQFSSPYPGNSFRCDICKNIGVNQWLYRCITCGFDAHLNCTKLQTPPYQNHFQHIPTTSTNSRSAPQHHSAGVDHMNQGINNEISYLETLRKQREDEDKLMAEMIMGAVSHENQRLNQLIDVGLGRTNAGINNATANAGINNATAAAAAAPQLGASQNNEMSLPEFLRKQREDQDKMIQGMIMDATNQQNQQLSHLIAASALHNQAINQQFNQTLMSYGSAAAGQGGGTPNLYQNTMGAAGFNTGGAVNFVQGLTGSGGIAGLGLSALFGNLNF